MIQYEKSARKKQIVENQAQPISCLVRNVEMHVIKTQKNRDKLSRVKGNKMFTNFNSQEIVNLEEEKQLEMGKRVPEALSQNDD